MHEADTWSHLKTALHKADHILNTEVYEVLKTIFLTHTSTPQAMEDLQRTAPEYGKREFLLSVDKAGKPALAPADVATDFAHALTHNPGFETWMQIVPLNDGRPGVLIARWLCHRSGFRHRTVHLFIDHPLVEDYSFIQVRSLDKAEAPGRFDLPAAGHIVALESVTTALAKELEEELGLTLDHIENVEEIGGYEYRDTKGRPDFYNVEFRVVHRTRLKPEALGAIRFLDGEVAALAIFSLPELQALLQKFPNRVASGLTKSLPLYMKRRRAHLPALHVPPG